MACEKLFLFISFITCLLVLYHIALNFIALKRIEKNFFPAQSTTEKRETMLTKTVSMKTTIMITKQQITEQNNTIGIYNIKIMHVWNAMYDFVRHVLQIHIFQFLFGILRRSTEGTK